MSKPIADFAGLSTEQQMMEFSSLIEQGTDDATLIRIGQQLNTSALTGGHLKSMLYKRNNRAVEQLINVVESSLNANQAYALCEAAISHHCDAVVPGLVARLSTLYRDDDKTSALNALAFSALASQNELAAALLVTAGVNLAKHLENGVRLTPLSIFHEVSAGRPRNRIIAAAFVRTGQLPGQDLAREVKTSEQAIWLYERHPDKQSVLSGLRDEFRVLAVDQSMAQPG